MENEWQRPYCCEERDNVVKWGKIPNFFPIAFSTKNQKFENVNEWVRRLKLGCQIWQVLEVVFIHYQRIDVLQEFSKFFLLECGADLMRVKHMVAIR